MKKVVFSIISIALLCVFISCKDETKKPEPPIVETVELALVDPSSIKISQNYVYVIARGGLSLREYNNLSSDKIALMPYGSKLKVITPENNHTMTVEGIKGGMHEIEFNHKTGFAFNGYLSKFFPPEQDISAKGYALDLKEQFPKTTYNETVGGTASKPSNTTTIQLPTTEWHEAYFIAQQLFDFPKEFGFPNLKGRDEEIIKGKKPKSGITDELRIKRIDNTFDNISYVYSSKKFHSVVTIIKKGNLMQIEKTETIE